VKAAPYPEPQSDRVTLRRIFKLWSPLALSWLCMALELPLITAVVGRMASPEVQMAAIGSIAFPLALLIEGPVVMMLSASTALCRDRQSLQRVRRYAMTLGIGLSGVHALVCFPALYNPLVGDLIGATPLVQAAGHPALWAMIPWTAAIAYRRFHQGILIRAERGTHVTQGTLFRLLGDVVVLSLCYHFEIPGALTAGLALSVGVCCEALFVGWVVRPSVRELEIIEQGPAGPIDLPRFVRFYAPLAVTPILGFMAMPLGAAAMNRLPFSIESLAVWQALHGLVFVPRSLALAYNEVVIRLSEVRGSLRPLMNFSRILALSNTALLGVFALSPWGVLLFESMFDMHPTLAVLGAAGLLCSLPQPGLMAGQSFHLGWLVGHGQTGAITKSMLIFLGCAVGGMLLALRFGHEPGLIYVAGSFSLATLAQVTWLSLCSRPSRLAVASLEADSD